MFFSYKSVHFGILPGMKLFSIRTGDVRWLPASPPLHSDAFKKASSHLKISEGDQANRNLSV